MREHQKFLKFIFRGQLYQFTALPNGLGCGPRKFTKLLKPVLSTLREEGTTIAAYIDDLITLARSWEKCSNNICVISSLLDELGFVVHPEKSVFTPTQVLEYLGFIINSLEMTVRLTPTKSQGIIKLCHQVLNSPVCTIREVAQLLGKFTSSFPAVQFGKLHYRRLEKQKILSLKDAKGDFNAPIILNDASKQDIWWWVNNLSDAFG